MSSNVDYGTFALYRLEDGVNRIQNSVRGAYYGARLASRRIGDLTAKGGPLVSAVKKSAEEMKKISSALERIEEDLTDIAVLAYAAHFSEFLRALLNVETPPALPETIKGVEELAGTPGALAKADNMFPLFLALTGTSVRGGKLDKRALQALGRDEVEIPFSLGKMLLFREGDRVGLTDKQLEAMGKAILDAGRILRSKRG
ncbi:hypothetical protein EPN96_11710 [bacterium]|nr:MAG: hypothetical protein EPN96_11710 [bacterium]